ncbi:hypothetical protein [Undibacterium sp. WLX3042]|uniref:hypothetical protein n=1 Tax=Undibacterium sp. WLX3042 TaxID=3412686 RepID=UPI003C2B18B9
MSAHFRINAIAAIVASLLIAGISQVAEAHDHGWRRGHYDRYDPEPVRNYNYIYYPSHQVYFSPQSQTWYWSDGRGWEANNRLPYFISIDARFGGIPVVLSSARPYVYHQYVEQRYGRPWREHENWRSDRDDRHEWKERHRHHHRED